MEWRRTWISWRNAILSDARFHRWAAEFPLTRPVAHREADRLFDLVAGFVYSQVLYAAVRLDLFGKLAEGPRTTADLAAATDLPVSSVSRLLGAAHELRLLDRLGVDAYALGPAGAAFAGNAGLAEMVAHHDLLYADLADPVAFLKRGAGGGALAAFWPYAGAETPAEAQSQSVVAYSRLMAASQPMIASDILHAYPFSHHRRVLDIGGGEGAFIAAVAAHAPDAALMLFDLPAVAAHARSVLDSRGLHRVEVTGGDVFRDPPPPGADLVTLVRVLHDHDDDAAQAILRGVWAALPPGGTVLVAEPMSRAPARDPMAGAYFGLYLMAMGSGRIRQPSEYKRFLSRSGFVGARRWPTRNPMLASVLTGRKPKNSRQASV